MVYIAAEAREQLLDTLAGAIEQLGLALAALGEAYEALDENTAETLEQGLFRPVQSAYGRAQRTHLEFADRHELPRRSFSPAAPGAPSHGVKGFLGEAMDAIATADSLLGGLQDSMLPVEVGDAELRAGLQDVRALLGPLSGQARELLRRLGR